MVGVWSREAPLSRFCSWYALVGLYLLCIHIACCYIFIFVTHVGTLPGSNTTWGTTKQRLILSVNLCFFSVFVKPHVVVHMHALPMRPLFVYLFVVVWAWWSSGWRQSATASRASAVFLPLPSPFLRQPSLRCRGYSRTWCGSWPVRLCSTDGPVLSPSLLLLVSASSVPLSCAAALQPWYL